MPVDEFYVLIKKKKNQQIKLQMMTKINVNFKKTCMDHKMSFQLNGTITLLEYSLKGRKISLTLDFGVII